MFRDGATITGRRECRICHCHEQDPCFEVEGQGPAARLRRVCSWAGPDLCSFCAEDGGPRNVVNLPEGPEYFSGLVDMYGQPLRWSKDLPKA